MGLGEFFREAPAEELVAQDFVFEEVFCQALDGGVELGRVAEGEEDEFEHLEGLVGEGAFGLEVG
jgi:hypothetical protein